MPMAPKAEIKFGTDGWRGIVADDFTYDNVRRVAQGIADYLKDKRQGATPLAVVGYDCRFASEEFAREVARVFAGNGIKVLIFDRPSPTQVASWTVIDRKADGAAIITASHNPWLFNGVKYKPETGSSAPTEVIRDLERRIADIDAASVKRADEGVETYEPLPAYFEQVGRMVDLPALRGSGLKVLHECMFGSGYGYLSGLLAGGSTQVTELHSERNPYFGGVNPEPIPRNLQSSLATMKSGGYDLCVATDGDADRVGIIDEKGRFITQLEVYALLMLYLFEIKGWRGPVVKTVNMTSMADQLAKEFKVPVYEVPVGFKFVAPKMMETEAVLGGEESGGFGIRGHIPERDGLLAGLFFADMIVRYRKPISEVLADLQARVGPHAYERRDVPMRRETYDRDRQVILKTLAEKAPKEVAGQKVERVRDDDGFKFYLADGSWVLVRTSGTEPLIRIYSEAATKEDVTQRLDAMSEVIGVESHGGG
ncbi:MAG: phosphoglucomutase/phosphomannomutase family protein [Chloroflexi bacterium]|nr:MAG: phosphoglucomutase/phosphomannomutase family protein [Chloroflexota bacterium]